MGILAPGFAGGRRFLRSRKPPRVARVFPSFALPPAKPRPVGLNLTSMIDVLVVTLVFLLVTFTSNPECSCARQVDVPGAGSAIEMIDAPLVTVTQSQISIDGREAGVVREDHKVQRIDELFNALKAKRETWKSLHPGKEFHGAIVLQIDSQVPSGVVKSVSHTAALSGYPNLSFMVAKI